MEGRRGEERGEDEGERRRRGEEAWRGGLDRQGGRRR